MDLSEIASIAGKGGLYHIIKPTRGGVIVETLDEQKKKMVMSTNNRVSVLKEVSIYTTDSEGSVPLETIFQKIYTEFGDDPGVESTSDTEELKAFVQHMVPNYDEDRVYPSDMKKLVSWYNILYKFAPDVLKTEDKAKAEKSDDEEVTASSEDTTPAAEDTAETKADDKKAE